MGIAETSHRLAPIFPAEISATLDPGDLLPVRNQARTAGASLDFAVEDGKPTHPIITSHGHYHEEHEAHEGSTYKSIPL
jgi:hypothetical protein